MATFTEDFDTDWEMAYHRVCVDAEHLFQWALSVGIPKEKAQAILPRGLSIDA
jgi:hypothetical protein